MYKFKNGKGYFNEDLPLWKSGTYEGKVNRKDIVGMQLSGVYEEWKFNGLYILEYIPKKSNPSYNIKYGQSYFNIDCDYVVAGNLKKILESIDNEFEYETHLTFKNNRRDLTITHRTYKVNNIGNKSKYYKYTCNVCGWTEGYISSGLLNRGCGCSCCSGKTAVLGINTIWDTDRWMCDLGVSEEDAKKYTRGSDRSITIICPDCNRSKTKKISDLYKNKSIGCSCNDGNSYISKYIHSVLNQLNIEYKTEVKYEWNKYINPKNNKLTQASIDFVINYSGREIPLEADGEFHRKDNKMSGITYEMHKSIDKQRDENCLKFLGEETIRISDEGDIKENVLNSKLNELFDLSEIDWIKCEEFALKNIVKEVCDYWNNKEDWEIASDLSKSLKLATNTITKYLKKGAKLGWCDYDPKEELRKSCYKNGKLNGKLGCKPVHVFKDGVLLGVFNSGRDLERESVDMFGINIDFRYISSVCTGRMKHYKGFTFKYAS